MIIGITGSIGSGKSTVVGIFSKYGYTVIDADEIGHKFLEKGSIQNSQLVEYFGKEILDRIGNIDRMKLGSLAFSEKKKYRQLNKIMLSPIIKEIKSQVKQPKMSGGNAVIDAPLLLESGAKNLVEKIVVVKASRENIWRRNKGFSKERIINVMKFQKPISQKLKYADYVINNDGNIKSLENQVRNIISAISKKV